LHKNYKAASLFHSSKGYRQVPVSPGANLRRRRRRGCGPLTAVPALGIKDLDFFSQFLWEKPKKLKKKFDTACKIFYKYFKGD
jgi:hypothetical protein